MTTAEFEEIMRNNCTSVMICSSEVVKQMIAQKSGGKIVNFSSIHASISEPNCSAYTAAKGAIEAFSRTLATEVAPYKINVNCIQPGATYSELTTPMYTKPVVEALFKQVPMKEIAQPEWIARGVVFLASDDSRYMTGEVLVMDGDYRMDGSLPDAAYWEMGKYFLHITGHGIGWRYHEFSPLLAPGNNDVLEEGMVMSVEPGVYIPGFGGMRIEDIVAVRKDDAERLTTFSRSLI
jgi:hypothetical protein